ncbi:LPXTG cell wall anchor domain-containing protein [Streptomyces griseoincarnatus]
MTEPPTTTPPTKPPTLPETGAGERTLIASGVTVLLLVCGTILYRRGRAASRR